MSSLSHVSKVLLAAIVIALTVGCTFFETAGAPPEVSMSYSLALDSASLQNKIGHVAVSVTNLTLTTIAFTTYAWMGETYVPVPILNVGAIDENGNHLSVSYSELQQEWGVKRVWVIARPSSAKTVRLSYDISFQYYIDRIDSYAGYVGFDYALGVGAFTFLVPDGYSASFMDARFNLPAGWKVVAPWQREGDHYKVSSVDELTTATFGLGDFQAYSKLVEGTNVTIAAYGGWTEYAQKQLTDYSFTAFQYAVNLFATNPRKEYLAIFCPPATDGKDISGWAESSQSQGIAVWNWEGWDRQSGIGWKRPLLHRVIHIWNAFPPYAMQPKTSTPDWTNWFLEGSTDYYDYDKALIQFQVLSGHSVLAGFFQTYLTRYLGSKYDVPISEAYRFVNEPEQYFFLMYHKGALISFLLDSLLQRLTGNRVSLDDVMRTLYNKFGDMRGTYTNHDIMTIGSALANYDLSRFFNNYVYQNTKLPFLQQNQNLLVDWQALGQILILNLTLASASVTSLSTVVQTSSIKTPTAIATTSSFSAIPTAATSSESTHTYEGINFQPLLLVSILTVFALIVIGWKVRRKVQ